MPKKYPKDQKLNALALLSMYGNNVSTVHQLSGIPIRTLYRWRSELNQKQQRPAARKNVENDTTATQNPDIRHKTPDSRHNRDANTDAMTQPRHKHPHSDAAATQKYPFANNTPPASDLESDTAGIPGLSYPYPLENDADSNDDYEDFRQLRNQLMEHARQLVANLNPTADDISLRTLALARILDRILQLDDIIPRIAPEKVMRFEYVYDGAVHNVPPWQGASENYQHDQERDQEEIDQKWREYERQAREWRKQSTD